MKGEYKYMNEEYRTTDMATYGYIMLRSQIDDNIKTRLKQIIRENGKKAVFVFEDPENQSDQLVVDFINSDIKQFDSIIRDVKKIIFQEA